MSASAKHCHSERRRSSYRRQKQVGCHRRPHRRRPRRERVTGTGGVHGHARCIVVSSAATDAPQTADRASRWTSVQTIGGLAATCCSSALMSLNIASTCSSGVMDKRFARLAASDAAIAAATSARALMGACLGMVALAVGVAADPGTSSWTCHTAKSV